MSTSQKKGWLTVFKAGENNFSSPSVATPCFRKKQSCFGYQFSKLLSVLVCGETRFFVSNIVLYLVKTRKIVEHYDIPIKNRKM
ncbi:unnamed protein product [Rhizophagus irregularis]|nr:unnamed protein product [Rhizophagus irregularis]